MIPFVTEPFNFLTGGEFNRGPLSCFNFLIHIALSQKCNLVVIIYTYYLIIFIYRL